MSAKYTPKPKRAPKRAYNKAAGTAVAAAKAQRISIQLLQARLRDCESRLVLIERWYDEIREHMGISEHQKQQ